MKRSVNQDSAQAALSFPEFRGASHRADHFGVGPVGSIRDYVATAEYRASWERAWERAWAPVALWLLAAAQRRRSAALRARRPAAACRLEQRWPAEQPLVRSWLRSWLQSRVQRQVQCSGPPPAQSSTSPPVRPMHSKPTAAAAAD